MKNILEQIIILIQFMTRIPINIKVEYSEEKLGKSIKWFPLVGLIIGMILYGVCYCLNMYIENKILIGIILIVIELLVIGIIHIDGLADSFDALFSYATKEKMLEIMKDARIGVNGAVVVIIYFIMKVVLLSEIINIDMKYILLYPVIARMSTSVNAGFGSYARESGMSTNIINMNSKKDGVYSIIMTIIISFTIMRMNGILLVLIGLVFVFWFRYIVYKKINGITGDTMGASLEILSILILLMGVIIK